MNWYKVAKEDNSFVYYNLEKDFWKELINKEKDRSDFHFDLENNDTVDKSKDFEIDKVFVTIGGAKYKYKVTAQMMSAGGDWENPVRYFRCQCAEKTEIRDEWGKYDKGDLTFIYIPSKEKGNLNVVKRDKGGWRTTDGIDTESKKIDDKKLWDSLKKHCPKRIQEYYDDKYADYDTDCKKIIKEHGIYGQYDLSRVFGE